MNAAKEAFTQYLNDVNLDSRQIYFVNQIVEYIVHNGVMKDLSVLQEPPFTDQGSIQVLVYKNKCTKLSSGASLNPQLSGEVHTPVEPQTIMGLVGH